MEAERDHARFAPNAPPPPLRLLVETRDGTVLSGIADLKTIALHAPPPQGKLDVPIEDLATLRMAGPGVSAAAAAIRISVHSSRPASTATVCESATSTIEALKPSG